MIGIVVVSHSRRLAEAAVDLASEMVPAESRPAMAVAAGLDETTFGTDAAAIAEAISAVDAESGASDGVLVLLDLGSAILSAEMALEFIDPDVAERVRLSPAPLVEGLVAAVVTAGSGADLDTVAREATDGLLAKIGHLGEVADAAHPVATTDESTSPADASFTWTVTNPHGLHARPASALVAALAGLDARVEVRNASTGAGPADARSVNRLAALGLRRGDNLVAEAWGRQAAEAVAALEAGSATQFGDAPACGAPAGSAAADDATRPAGSSSTSTGRQVVLAPALVLAGEIDASSYRSGDDEPARVQAAIEAVADDLSGRASGPHGDIFAAQRALLTDPEVSDDVTRRMAEGATAPEAVRDTFDALAASYETLDDPYLRERAQDQRSLGRQVLTALLGATEQADEVAGHPHVLVVDELDAATAAGLDAAVCQGVITLTGGATGHGVIVATGRGIPVLTGVPEAGALATGDLVGFDPTTREWWQKPDHALIGDIRERARDRAEREADMAAHAHEPALSPEGVEVLVEANLSSLADAVTAAAAGADGSGLVRTELLWGHLSEAPSAQQQADDLIALGTALGGRPLTVRTWDVGGDKPLPFLPQQPELNPFLGERGLRTMPRALDLFREQLRGILIASIHTPLRVMFPMVTEPDEMVWAREQYDAVLAELGVAPIPVGMMVEVPAAALRADEFSSLVDFVSIGTNDLTQYTTAVDRGNGAVAHLGRADSPGVLALIELTCAALPDVPVAVCGDLASDPEQVSRLVGYGVTELSVRPPLIAAVKHAVRHSHPQESA